MTFSAASVVFSESHYSGSRSAWSSDSPSEFRFLGHWGRSAVMEPHVIAVIVAALLLLFS